MTIDISWEQVFQALRQIDNNPRSIVYGIPKGGMIASAFLLEAQVTHDPKCATIILDDIVDSGKTKSMYMNKYPHAIFHCLFDKQLLDTRDWVTFPWEREHPAGLDTIQQNLIRLIEFIGDDPTRDGLQETPDRVIRSYAELFNGYSQDPKDVFKTFDEPQIGGMVYMKDIEFFSTCEHHILPFFGMAHIGYIPKGPVIGASKMARLLDVFARRLSIQERIGEQVTTALMDFLKPAGAACIIEAKHLCIACRGVKKQHSAMGYSSMKGVFLDNPAARMEFIGLIK